MYGVCVCAALALGLDIWPCFAAWTSRLRFRQMSPCLSFGPKMWRFTFDKPVLVDQKKFKKVTKMRIFRIRIRKYVVSGVETLDLGTILGKSESNEDLSMIWGQNDWFWSYCWSDSRSTAPNRVFLDEICTFQVITVVMAMDKSIWHSTDQKMQRIWISIVKLCEDNHIWLVF